VPLPYVHAVPAVAKATVETKQFESVDAATPADTTKIELTTKEHEINVPAVKYVQPTLKYKPITYKTVSPFTYAHGLTYSHALPYAHGLTYSHGLPFAGYPYGPFFGAPLIKAEAAAEEAPAVEEVRRRRRDVEEVSVPLPYVHAVPAVAKATVETKQFESVDAATPADTTKIELTTKEHEINVPAVKYVQPTLKYKPITYKTVSPFTYAHGLTYAHGFPYAHGLTYSHGLPFTGYPFGHFVGAPVIKVDEE